LLKGLEVSELLVSKVNEHPEFRIDSEYFNIKAIEIEDIIKNKSFSLVEEISDLFAGPFGSTVTVDCYVPSKEYRYIRGKDIQNFFLEKLDSVYINKDLYNSLDQFHLRPRDILVTVVGAKFGQAAILYDEDCPAIFSCKSTLLRTKGISPFYLVAFLLSKHGHLLVRRSMRGMAQPGINLLDLATIPILRISSKLEKAIEECIIESKQIVKQSEFEYKKAETLLLETFGLKDFQPSREAVNVKSFKDSFLTSGRLDAEYYQVKYEEVINRINAQNHDLLKNLVKIKKSIEPGSAYYSEEGLPFLRVSDYNKFGLSEPDKKLSPEFCKENAELIKRLKPKKETILFSKDGSVGTAYMLRKDGDFITSGAILHLTVKDKSRIIPEYLTLALNSQLVQMQAERDAGGSIILHWRVNEIENVVVPVIDYTKQQTIAILVEKSFQLKKQSEQLLEVAKRAVEIAIEQDERAALGFIENTVSITDSSD